MTSVEPQAAPTIRKGVQAMLVASFAFAVMSALVKSLGARIPSVEIATVRGVVTLVLAYGALRRAGLSPWGERNGWLVVRGVLGVLGLQSYFFSLTHLPLAEATVVQFLNPILVALLAPLVLREAPSARDALAGLLGFAGIVCIARPLSLFGGAAGLDPMGLAVGLFGALMSASVYLVIRKLRGQVDPLVVVFHFPLIALPLSLPLAVPVWVWPTPSEWGVLALIGAMAQWGQVAMTRSLHVLPAARGTALSFVQVAFAMLFSVLFFHEVPGLLTGLGALLVFAGASLLVFTRRAS